MATAGGDFESFRSTGRGLRRSFHGPPSFNRIPIWKLTGSLIAQLPPLANHTPPHFYRRGGRWKTRRLTAELWCQSSELRLPMQQAMRYLSALIQSVYERSSVPQIPGQLPPPLECAGGLFFQGAKVVKMGESACQYQHEIGKDFASLQLAICSMSARPKCPSPVTRQSVSGDVKGREDQAS